MTRIVAFVLAVSTLVMPEALQAQSSKGATKDPRILAYDKGPDKINVSKYPSEVKSLYKLFEKRCSACHTLARAVNSDFVLDEEWQRYIRQMMDRSGTLISATEAKDIFTFLQYDSRNRKKALYDKKIAIGTK
jgi:hypothetical protein